MDDLNKAFNHLFGFKVPIDDYDEFEKKVEEARELKEHLDKVEILKDISQIVTPVKMTNYDRIKSMSVEEMADFFEGHFDCNFCPESERLEDSPLLKGEKCDERCTYHIKQWLLQEVSDE